MEKSVLVGLNKSRQQSRHTKFNFSFKFEKEKEDYSFIPKSIPGILIIIILGFATMYWNSKKGKDTPPAKVVFFGKNITLPLLLGELV